MSNPASWLPPAGEAIGALMQAPRHDMEQSIIPGSTLMLAGMRSSQINGGSACLFADAAEARRAEVTDDQMTAAAAWRQSPFFTAAERATLTPAATRMNDRSSDAIPDSV